VADPEAVDSWTHVIAAAPVAGPEAVEGTTAPITGNEH